MPRRSMELSLPAYLALEAADAERRHEYWEGECWAMSGTTPEHNDLVRALVRRLDDGLRGGPCRAYSESIRTRVGASK